jgi:hypothetical protein
MALAATDNRMGGLCAGINKTRHCRRCGRYLSRQGAARGQRSVSVHAIGDKFGRQDGQGHARRDKIDADIFGNDRGRDCIQPGVEDLAWTPSTSSC